MATLSVEKALENIYASIKNNNEDIDAHIAALKTALAGAKEVTVDPTQLAQNNRQGRKFMQTYFRKRGVMINFETPAKAS